MDLELSPKTIEYLIRIARERDTLFDQRNIKLLNSKRKIKKVDSKTQNNLEELKKELPSGIYTHPKQVVDIINQVLCRTNSDAISYSPFVVDYPELVCCKTMKYRMGNIITGRDKEIDDILLALTKSTKRGVVLCGEPGTGKTSIIRALNNRLIERNVPRQLNGCYIRNMDVPYIFSKYKEEAIGTIIKVLERASEYDKLILFIDEVHQLLGHRMNDMMKPYLTEKIRFIGSTTLDEYHTIINDDRALERRFTVIPIDEPNIDRTIKMVKGTKSVYEDYHKCIIPDNMCEYTVVNGSRFLGHRKNPDKSLDLLDIACSIMYEKEIKKNNPIYEKQEEFSLEQLDNIQLTVKGNKDAPGIRILTEDYVNEAIASVTGIPYGDIKNSLEYKQVVDNITSKIFGQEEQIKSLANVVNIFKHIKADRTRPVSVLLLIGPSGTGKSITCRLLAKNLYGDDNCFIDFDMGGLTSEFQLSELRGAPPGYIGYSKSGKLVKEVKRNPQSVVYFRGINKAHDTIKQYIFDACRNGRFTDSAEREVELKNTVIIYSVTVSDDEYKALLSKGKSNSMGFIKENQETTDGISKQALVKIVGDELVKSVDEIICFNSLDNNVLDRIYEANIDNYLNIYDVDVDKSKLKKTVLEESKNGHHVISRIMSEVPKMVFQKLKG